MRKRLKNIITIIFSVIVIIILFKSCSYAFNKEYEQNIINNQQYIQNLKNDGLLPIDY